MFGLPVTVGASLGAQSGDDRQMCRELTAVWARKLKKRVTAVRRPAIVGGDIWRLGVWSADHGTP